MEGAADAAVDAHAEHYGEVAQVYHERDNIFYEKGSELGASIPLGTAQPAVGGGGAWLTPRPCSGVAAAGGGGVARGARRPAPREVAAAG